MKVANFYMDKLPQGLPDGSQAVADDHVKGRERGTEHELRVAELSLENRTGYFVESYSVLENKINVRGKAVEDVTHDILVKGGYS